MPNLVEWKGWPSSSRMKEGEVQVSVFPVLKSLKIKYCPNLRTFPPLPLSIQQLELWDCSEKIYNLTALKSLEISYCDMLVSLPKGTESLTSLKSLSIDGCHCLKSLNSCLQFLTNLHDLEINNCRELELLPDDFQNLIFLQSLSLDCLPKQGAVPVVGSLTLNTISLDECHGLTNLPEWITNQRSLQTLDLDECKNLESLAEGLQHLTALQLLYIRGCHPELYRRCQKNTGEDWHKIAHIPELLIRCDPKSLRYKFKSRQVFRFGNYVPL